MPTTEIAVASLKTGVDLSDTEGSAASVLQSTFGSMTVDGVQQVRYGTAVEDPTKLHLLITWDSLAKHQEFMRSDAFGPFVAKVGTIMDGSPSVMHIDFQPEAGLTTVLQAPVTEVATLHFDDEPPADYYQVVANLNEVLKDTEGYVGYAVGVSHETVEKDGVKGKSTVLVAGWQSIEAHMALRQKSNFMEIITTLRSTSKGGSMYHVKFGA